METTRSTSPARILIACCLLSMVLGQIHAFSVFLTAAETRFGSSRSMVAMAYSIGLICLTLAVLWGARLYPRMRPTRVAILALGGGFAGVALAAFSENILWFWVGYGVIFGGANGLGYGFGLQYSARVLPAQRGIAMGAVTAAYALGAVVGAPIVSAILSSEGYQMSMFVSGAFLVSALGAVAYLFAGAPAMDAIGSNRTDPEAAIEGSNGHAKASSVAKLWLAYLLSVSSGLMVIAHAAGISKDAGLIWSGGAVASAIACANLAGSLGMAWLSDRVGSKRILAILPAVSFAALCLLWAGNGGWIFVGALVALGFTYGGIIAVWPAAIAVRYGAKASPLIYGRVFTAWGAAGLLGPWIAGRAFDLGGGYGPAFLIAALLALAGVACTWFALQEETKTGA